MLKLTLLPIIIFASGDGADFLIVALYDFHVHVKVQLGAGTFEADVKNVKESGERFDDGRWHHVVITRTAREVTDLYP